MHILLLSPRFPWPPFTGDRLRATIWLSALAASHDVTLIAPLERKAAAGAAALQKVRFVAAEPSLINAAAGVVRVLRGAPVQSLLAARYDWAGAIARAGRVDATIVLLSRLDPSVRALLPPGLRVFDAIDSLGRSMDERAREASPLLRPFWRAESRRVARVEHEAARVYDRVLTVSADEAADLRAEAISNGVVIAPLGDAPRTFDFSFWGRLAYFANADAATWLLREIWPAIRARHPRATLLLGGADAPSHIRAAHGRDGVTVQSPVDDVAALARRVKVALFPVRYGTGQSNKVLEAAEGGCAVVATAKAMRGLEPLHGHAFIADDAASIARAATAALTDGSRAMRAAVETHFARQATLDRLAAVIQNAEAAA